MSVCLCESLLDCSEYLALKIIEPVNCWAVAGHAVHQMERRTGSLTQGLAPEPAFICPNLLPLEYPVNRQKQSESQEGTSSGVSHCSV